VVTPQGLEGIDAEDGKEVLVATGVSDFVDRITSVFKGESAEVGNRAKNLICNAHTWNDVFPKLEKWLPESR
jgi:hypothetical protein